MKDTRLHKDIRLHIVAMLALLLSLTAFPGVWYPLVLFAGTVMVLRLHRGWAAFRQRVGSLVLFAGVMSLSRLFLDGGETGARLLVGGISLPIYLEGLWSGIQLFLRVLAGAGLLTAFTSLVGIDRLVLGMRGLGLPSLLTDLLLLIFRYSFVLKEEARRLIAAARSRLAFSTWRVASATAGLVAGSLITRSIDRSDNIYRAMVARGYGAAQASDPVGTGGDPAECGR